MKVAAAILAVLGHVSAMPGYGISTKHEPTEDIEVQPLSQGVNTASLPVASGSSKEAKRYYEADMIPVKLIYELNLRNDETPAEVKQVSLESLTGAKKPKIKISNRVARTHKVLEDSEAGNDFPLADHGQNVDSPSHEMYDDNFGGEHDSQEGKIPDGSFRSQHLIFDSDSYNRALTVDGPRKTPLPSISSAVGPPTEKQNGVVRTIQRYQSMSLPPSVVTVKSSHPPGSGSRHLPRVQASSPSFPQAVYNPYGEVWSAYTNIVEYGTQSGNTRYQRDLLGQKTTSKKERTQPKPDTFSHEQEEDRLPGYQTFFADDLSRGESSGPRIMRLKVRRGGVAIAGPGGIASAGSGGTAIVGPGGTAYTTRDGTAVVGPGGRVIQVPNTFHTTKIEARSDDPNYFFVPPGGKVLAEGPFIYYGAPHLTSIERL